MKNIDFLMNNLIAHRGCHNKELNIPENSLLAFKRAIRKGYIIELDVHILKDENIVVFHDDNLLRMTGIDKKIMNTTYEEIKDLKLDNTNEKIPLLEDVLKLVDGRVPLLIELKYDTKLGLLENNLLKVLSDYKGVYAFQSFNPFSLMLLKKKFPNIKRGLLVSDFKKSKISFFKKFFLRKMLLNFVLKLDFLSVNYNFLSNKKIKRLRSNMLILTWTIRKKDYLNKYKNLCDNYIVENI